MQVTITQYRRPKVPAYLPVICILALGAAVFFMDETNG